MELRDYVRILHKSWVLIFVFLLLGIGFAAAYSIVVTPKYEATTELYVSVRSGDSAATGDLVQGTNFARQAVTSYVDVVDSAIVLDRVIDELQLDATSAELGERIESSSPLNTVLIHIVVSDSDPELAAAIANSVGSNFADIVVNDLEKPEGEAPSLVKIETIQPATVPPAPSSPTCRSTSRSAHSSVSRSASALRCCAACSIRASTRRTTWRRSPTSRCSAASHSTRRRASAHSSCTPIRSARARSRSGACARTCSSSTSRAAAQLRHLERGPGEGKSTTTANLAISLAETGESVALHRRRSAQAEGRRVPRHRGRRRPHRRADRPRELVDVMQPWGGGASTCCQREDPAEPERAARFGRDGHAPRDAHTAVRLRAHRRRRSSS